MKQSRSATHKSGSTSSFKSRIAVISATWHTDIVARARDAFLAEADKLGQPAKTIDLYEVPGAFEIPLVVQEVAAKGGRSVMFRVTPLSPEYQ